MYVCAVQSLRCDGVSGRGSTQHKQQTIPEAGEMDTDHLPLFSAEGVSVHKCVQSEYPQVFPEMAGTAITCTES